MEIRNVTVSYGKKNVLRNVNLSINRGEFFSIVGSSGCGKSTLLRSICGFIPINSGSVLIDGVDITKLPSEKRQIGYVSQNYSLFPGMKVSDNIAFGLKMRKTGKREINFCVKEIAEQLDIRDCLEKQVNELSGGEQQRIAIARTIILKPKILLLDEPVSNVDVGLKNKINKMIFNLHEKLKMTCIYVTHDYTDALKISNRMAVMSDGRILQVGNSRSIYYDAVDDYVYMYFENYTTLSKKILRAIEQQFGGLVNSEVMETKCLVRFNRILFTHHKPLENSSYAVVPVKIRSSKVMGCYYYNELIYDNTEIFVNVTTNELQKGESGYAKIYRNDLRFCKA